MDNSIWASPGSYRDPDGQVFTFEGRLYRKIRESYQEHYDHLIKSGLYDALVRDGLLVSHEEASLPSAAEEGAWKILKPRVIPFVSYPYEWCFSQLKAAALLTLRIQKAALARGMSLKDCSAYNVQFVGTDPVLIDTLSFEIKRPGPWVAYRQFCEHFLAPLAVMSKTNIHLNRLLSAFLEGIPLDMAADLLPLRSRASFSLFMHVFLHARSQKAFAGASTKRGRGKISERAILGLVDSLESAVRKMKWRPGGTDWADYYDDTNYSAEAVASKKRRIESYIDSGKPATVWDVGANTGLFSRIPAGRGIFTVSLDYDPAAVEKNYLDCVRDGESRILPLVMDMVNPSAGIGWHNRERMSLTQRGPAGMVLALALVHHLSITRNVPFEKIAELFAETGEWLVIEFIPKRDSQVQRLLSSRDDIFTEYRQEIFEKVFSRFFRIRDKAPVGDSERTLYLMEKTGRR